MTEVPLRLTVPERQIQRSRAMGNLKTRFPSVRDTPTAPNRQALWARACEHIGTDAPVVVLDFGVYEGRSTRFWLEHFKNPACEMVGFDSFIGLPEDWTGKMVKGTFSTEGAIPRIDDPRVSFQVGWIQNTLPPFLKSFRLQEGKKLFVHIDIDLYSAALFILTTLWHHFDEFHVMFDEFGVDENLALADFTAAYPVDLAFFGHTYSQKYSLPQQVFGHIRKTAYEV
jgi:hypothetical protein